MTATEDIRKGDRVRATSKTNDDMAEFTVDRSSPEHGCLYSEKNVYHSDSFTFEVLKRAEKPLPTEPGIYSPFDGPTDIRRTRLLLLTSTGEWFWLSCMTGTVEPAYDIVPLFRDTITLVYGGAK